MYEFDLDARGRRITPSASPPLLPGMSSSAYGMYRSFVHYRHLIWEARQKGFEPPWSPPANVVLNSKKFTNVFRVLDPGSQYVVQMLQEPGLLPRDALARAILYRFTNRPETWDHLEKVYGRWPLATDMNDELIHHLHETPGGKIFSGAYIIMPTPGKVGDKVAGAVALARLLTHPESPENVVDRVVGAATPAAAYEALRSHYGMGDFMSMQILTDWGYYSPTHDENAFVIAGPGSRRGVAHLFDTGAKVSTEDVIRWVRDRWWEDLACPTVPLPGSLVRAPSLMDIQNTFCEYSKYVRYLTKDYTNPSTPYRPAHPGRQPVPLLPHHWSATSR